VRRLLDRADGVSRKALREAVFYVVGRRQTQLFYTWSKCWLRGRVCQ